MRIVPEERWITQPWSNRRGVTREIVRWPTGSDAYDLRVSLADVTEPGSFSTFPGYRRWTFLVGPAPITLVEPGRSIRLVAPGDHIEVPGELPLVAELPAGPTQLLNILARPDTCVAGIGPIAHAIRFRFRFSLATREAAVLEPPASADTHDAIWLSDARAG